VSLLRIVNVPARGIGDVTLEHLATHARGHGLPLADVLAAPEAVPGLTACAARAVREFSELLRRMRSRLRTELLSTVTRGLLHEIGFEALARASTRSGASMDRRLRGVEGVLGSLEQFERREGQTADLLSYLNRLSHRYPRGGGRPDPCPGQPPDASRRQGAGIQDSLPGRDRGGVPPPRRNAGEPPDLEEERRLCDVGITRAREELILTRAATRLRRGRDVPRTPSRFLADIPGAVLEVSDTTAPPPGPPGEAELSFFRTLRARLQGGSPPSSA
jgi:DNA helicase-2/ATP-dependent DNA helicase PcrA